MLTGTQEDMKRIAQEGRLKAWCADNLEWLRRTFGAENVVSAVLHMDEATPHIHAAVVPIVTGERRKVLKEQTDEPNKRKYRTKSAARPRLCADDVMSRVKLKEYQDTYAAAMAKYGLQRGIDGRKPDMLRHRNSIATPLPDSRTCRTISANCSVSRRRNAKRSNMPRSRNRRHAQNCIEPQSN